MGEYVSLKIRNHDYLSCKNSFGDLLLLFSKEDLKIEEAKDEDGETYIRRYFSTTVSRAKMFLDCLGYTVKSLKRDFENSKVEELEYLEYCMDDEPSCESKYRDVNEKFEFEAWKTAAKKYALILADDFYDPNIGGYRKLENERKKSLSITEKIVIDSLPFYWNDKFFGLSFGSICIWNVFRVLLDAFEPHETIELDYSNLYDGGWCGETPEENDYAVAKTVILTEGKFDVEVIEQSIKLLYPFMSKFYSFINFSEYSVQGSTNFLTHYLKAFVASGIQNRVVAIYDNDSAGREEIINLSNIQFPNNFRIMNLPELEFAKNYPTLGPTGKEIADINGRACSIELFLGRDVLSDKGEFSPVHWKGYNEKTHTYQGEILDKIHIQKRFRNKIKNSSCPDLEDWADMKLLLNAIFNVFMEE